MQFYFIIFQGDDFVFRIVLYENRITFGSQGIGGSRIVRRFLCLLLCCQFLGSESVYPRNGILFPLHFGHLLLTRTREIGKADENKKNND